MVDAAAATQSACERAPRYEVHPSAGVRFGTPDAGAEKGWQPPASLHVDVATVVDMDTVTLNATLLNAGPNAVVALTLAGGMMPGSTNPFNAHVELKDRASRAPDLPGPPPVEVFPYPEAVTLPPGGTVHYTLRFCRARYESQPGATARVPWSFELWSGRKTGTVEVRLP
jgi:hypothetical protein